MERDDFEPQTTDQPRKGGRGILRVLGLEKGRLKEEEPIEITLTEPSEEVPHEVSRSDPEDWGFADWQD